MSFQWKIESFKLIVIILFLAMAGTAKAKEFTIFVDEWPPYNFNENGKIVGISTEIIETALQKANVQYKLVLYPFKRALLTVRKTPGTMLFTVARIPQREDMFAWIGPLHPRKLYLYKLKNRTDIRITDVKDIKKYRTGVLSGGSVEQFFITNGFHKSNYHLVSDSDQLLKLLFKKRVDLIPGDPLDLAYQAKNLKYKFSELEIAYFLSEEGGYYMIANKDTSDKILERIQKSLEDIMATGLRDRIIQKYIQ
ncbi:substrate-binding periplasmic protein [Maridesulfovibrio sp. FT414]|uniref:substrate-binding periplasmic protein n=1 Tax=Maridesulfovibrio sp. FT414 TaxID=2979469 RepID=UPI003D801770